VILLARQAAVTVGSKTTAASDKTRNQNQRSQQCYSTTHNSLRPYIRPRHRRKN